jgi:hypothetical protein
MIRDTRPQDATGMAEACSITQGRAKHGWQPYSAINDNGVDSLIIFRKNGEDTGEIMFAQVKCGTGKGYFKKTLKRPEHFGVKVGEGYINDHRPKWNKLPGPIILIYVDYYSKKAWWTDLKDDFSYSSENKSIILIPKKQRFGKHSFGEFKNLKGRLFVSKEIRSVRMMNDEFSYLKVNVPIKESAKSYYTAWANGPVNLRSHPELGEIIISRTGWRHLTRSNRKQNRIINSLSLLSVAKKIITTENKCHQIKQFKSIVSADNSIVMTDYLALKCNVIFPFRQSALVQVILKRKRKFNANNDFIGSRIWFYSVYELLPKK